MEKTYQPANIEKKWYQTWENAGYFIPTGKGARYCIVLPPPNVTGRLHMGHGFQISLMDALIRYQRMQGANTLWQVGTDHAGIATQMVVERQLIQEGKSRHELGRQRFIERVWSWKAQSDHKIKQQLRRMGGSMDWSRERFSLDEGICDAVHKVFVTLFDKGLIYRGKKLVNWDPVLQTAISDLEVINEERQGELWHISYPIQDSNDALIVTTTRPETLLGDIAVAVHPEDERYKHLIGKKVALPLTNRTIPIITDEYVDREFGTGCVKITPAHDFNDNDVAQRHNLPMLNIFTTDAHLNKNAPEKYQGLDRFEARKCILTDLKEQQLLIKSEPHLLKVPIGDRSGSIIEPYLTDQWFVKAKPLAEKAIKAVKNGDMKFVPGNWSKTYYQWLEGIHDWCISRHLWWGHRIPAWYDKTGNVFVGHSEKAVREKYHIDKQIELTQDEDVLDTWFSAALWPFTTLGWPEETHEFKMFYPTSVLVTGFDIIFFWVARMVMMGLEFTGKVPFHTVYITGLIRDSEGQKMSKSKGNILDPVDLIDGVDLESLIEKRTQGLMQPQMIKKIEQSTRQEFPNGIPAFGTDALRFTFYALATTGRDIRFDLGRIEGYRNFCNKIWNAARYVLMNTENQDLRFEGAREYSIADHWIRNKLQETIKYVHESFKTYRFDLIATTIYDFFRNEYCDWYLELCKPILTSDNSNKAQLRGTRLTLVQVLETFLRLLHPLMPFVTEEIWQRVALLAGKENKSIMLTAYPEYDKNEINQTAIDEIEWLKKMIIAVRNIRGEMNISPNKPLPLLLARGSKKDKELVNKHKKFLCALAKLESIDWVGMDHPPCATALVGKCECLIPMAGIIDKTSELTRLQKELGKLEKDMQRSSNKLNNPNYIEKAPKYIVEKEKKRIEEIQMAKQNLEKQLAKLETL